MEVRISDSERKIMDILWNRSPLTVNEIIEQIRPISDWSDATIKTFINRLRKKSMIIEEQRNVLYLYPAITREQAKISETKSILDKLYNGSVQNMVLNFIGEKQLSKQEADEIIKSLEKYKEGNQ